MGCLRAALLLLLSYSRKSTSLYKHISTRLHSVQEGMITFQLFHDFQVCEENTSTVPSIPSLPRLSCDPACAYIITGGLGGFGLELAQWLVERGARNLVLTSRAGRARNGFQARRLHALRLAGVKVEVSARDIGKSEEEATTLVQETQKNMGKIGGVFHLAMVSS